MKTIFHPILPPKMGYVEVEKDDGTRTYRNVETGILIEEEKPKETTEQMWAEMADAVREGVNEV